MELDSCLQEEEVRASVAGGLTGPARHVSTMLCPKVTWLVSIWEGLSPNLDKRANNFSITPFHFFHFTSPPALQWVIPYYLACVNCALLWASLMSLILSNACSSLTSRPCPPWWRHESGHDFLTVTQPVRAPTLSLSVSLVRIAHTFQRSDATSEDWLLGSMEMMKKNSEGKNS